ncbi:LytTR family DNA-binding domain-containing protein [Sphingomonas sp. DT-204]|uniref:LytTR family DNA-binding domain-containing protein n=1 Tax=Sphingomonas sp. DT-204 TaxID=3396166 RepID=UPI003F1DFA89
MRDFAISPLPGPVERIWAEIGLGVGLGLVLAVLGPFRTYESEPLQRIGFWIGLSALWFVMLMAVDLLIDRSPLAGRLTETRRLALKVALAAVPMLLFVAPATQALFDFTPDWHKLLHLYPKTLLIGAGLTLVSTAVFGGPLRWPDRRPRVTAEPTSDERSPAPQPPRAASAPIAPCPVRTRIPAHLHGPILCLETEDHYVRVYTPEGSGLILMRMRDAVAAMEESAGMRVHRSWWVARDAVKSGARAGRTLRLELANGLVVPVSQPYAAAVCELLGLT